MTFHSENSYTGRCVEHEISHSEDGPFCSNPGDANLHLQLLIYRFGISVDRQMQI